MYSSKNLKDVFTEKTSDFFCFTFIKRELVMRSKRKTLLQNSLNIVQRK